LYHALRNALAARGAVLISPPKAGTHLLLKALALLPGLRPAAVPGPLRDLAAAEAVAEAPLCVGVDWPVPLALATLRRWLAAFGRGRYADAHLPYSPAAADELDRRGLRVILILRDPRDVAVSHAEHIASHPEHFLHQAYQPLLPAQRLMTSIVGLPRERAGGPGLLDIGARFRAVMAWTARPSTLEVRFEDLVGPEGGGSRDAQLGALDAIARHLDARSTASERTRAAQRLFGGTATFRRGRIGSWREAFSPEHRRAFEERAGELLAVLGYRW
jgi:hypothetical protein